MAPRTEQRLRSQHVRDLQRKPTTFKSERQRSCEFCVNTYARWFHRRLPGWKKGFRSSPRSLHRLVKRDNVSIDSSPCRHGLVQACGELRFQVLFRRRQILFREAGKRFRPCVDATRPITEFLCGGMNQRDCTFGFERIIILHVSPRPSVPKLLRTLDRVW